MRRSGVVGVVGLVALLGWGCEGTDDVPPPPPPPDENVAGLRVVHASPDAPAVDVYAEGSETPLISDLEYAETSPFVSVPEGSYVLELRAAGAEASEAPVFTVDPVQLGVGDRVTAVAVGLLGSEDEADRFRVLALEHGFAEVGADQVRARVVHAGADAPAVDLDVGDDGSAELTGLERFDDTGAEGVELPAGEALQLAVLAGDERVTAFTTPALPAGAELFLLAVGSLEAKARDEDGFGLLAVGPEGTLDLIRQNPVVYALHASPDAPTVDVFAGDAELVDALSFGELSGPLQVPPGTYDLDFFAAASGTERPEGDPAASFQTPELAAGERYLVSAAGFLAPRDGGEAFGLLPLAEAFADADGREGARLRLLHASPDAPAVDVGVVEMGVLGPLPGWSGLSFGDATEGEGLDLDAVDVTVGVAPAGTTDPVASFALSPVAGMEAFVVAAGALSPETEEAGFRLLVVDTSVEPWSVTAVEPQ